MHHFYKIYIPTVSVQDHIASMRQDEASASSMFFAKWKKKYVVEKIIARKHLPLGDKGFTQVRCAKKALKWLNWLAEIAAVWHQSRVHCYNSKQDNGL